MDEVRQVTLLDILQKAEEIETRIKKASDTKTLLQLKKEFKLFAKRVEERLKQIKQK